MFAWRNLVRNQNMVLALGLPGIGKDTVLKAVKPESGWKIVSVGSVMFDIAQKKGYAKKYGVEVRDDMRNKLSAKQQAKLQDSAFRRIAMMKGNIILNTHSTVNCGHEEEMLGEKGIARRVKENSFIVGISKDKLKMLNLSKIIYYTADKFEELIARRADPTRVRDNEDVRHLSIHDDLNLTDASQYAFQANVPLTVILNRQGEEGLELARMKTILALKTASSD